MRLRSLVIIFMMLLATGEGKAQSLEWGGKLGFTHQNFGDAFGNWDRFSKKFNKDFGFELGVYGRAKFSGFYIQPEVMFHRTNKQFEIDNGNRNLNITYSRLNIPIMVGQRYFKVLRLNTGPVGTLQIAGKSDDVDQINYNNFNIGAQLGFGLDIWRIRFDARYQLSFTKLTSGSVEINGQEFNASSYGNFFLLELGYRFND